MSKYISVTDTAKLVRTHLKKEFPKTKFTVRSSSYSGGASVDVRWTDGATSTEVDEILHRYESASMNLMEDLKEYHDSLLDGEQVHFGADFVHGQRDFSITFIMRCAVVTAGYFKQPVPVMNRYNWFEFTAEPVFGRFTLIECIQQVMSVTNADDETLHGGYGRVAEWIEDAWMKVKHPELIPLIDAAPAPVENVFAKYNQPERNDNRVPFSNAADFEADYEAGDIDEAQIDRLLATVEDEANDLDNQVWALQHPEDEAEDTTPCVKVNPLTLEVIEQPALVAIVEDGIRCLRPDTLRERLAGTDLNTLSPLEALTLLYELKRLA